MAFHLGLDWHDGEKKMHKLLRVPEHDNPTVSMLSQQAARMLQIAPLIAIGTLDSQDRPWTTIWGGAKGLSQPLGNSLIGVKTFVDRMHDPVVDILYGSNQEGEVVREQGDGRMIGGLAIDLTTRKRVKIFGRLVAGAVAPVQEHDEDDDEKKDKSVRVNEIAAHQVQLVCRIDQSLGNCPKYLNSKDIRPEKVASSLLSQSADLIPGAVDLIKKSDLFFVSSSHSRHDMDTNHRGGPPGFVRTFKTPSGQWQLYWPEYSGNRLYQTLGNLQETPLAGLVFPDFQTGDVLYLTGHTEILIGKDAAHVLPRSNLAVQVTVIEARYVRCGLPFRGSPGELSPYNPKVRPLASEAKVIVEDDKFASANTATLLEVEQITPTIYRYQFSLSNPGTWKAGQWVALDFSSELDIGYSHMRDDDPLSINDDFIRTFTVSSPPAPQGDKASDDKFEITVRNIGPVTGFMSKQRGGGSLDIPIRGFGGEVAIQQEVGAITPFVAGGVGITPLLAQLPGLDLRRLHVFWTLHHDDLDLVLSMLSKTPDVAEHLAVYVTGTNGNVDAHAQSKIDKVRAKGAACRARRLEKSDLEMPELGNRWHVCVSTRLRESLSEWLRTKEMIYEDFNF